MSVRKLSVCAPAPPPVPVVPLPPRPPAPAPLVPAPAPLVPALAPLVPALAPLVPALAPLVPALAPLVPALAPLVPPVSDAPPAPPDVVIGSLSAHAVSKTRAPPSPCASRRLMGGCYLHSDQPASIPIDALTKTNRLRPSIWTRAIPTRARSP